jgi:hypothetical protein
MQHFKHVFIDGGRDDSLELPDVDDGRVSSRDAASKRAVPSRIAALWRNAVQEEIQSAARHLRGALVSYVFSPN